MRARIVQITNRSTVPLDVMCDGAPDVIPPGYRLEKDEKGNETLIGNGPLIDGVPTVLSYPVEYFAAEIYKRQHPVMGTQDPHSVDARDTEYLLGIAEWGDLITPIEQTDADELIDRSMLPAQRQNAMVLRVGIAGSPRDVKAKKDQKKVRSKLKAEAQAGRRAAFVDTKLVNPTGMRANYE